MKEEIERLRRWEIASFAAVGWAAEDSAVALERGMRTLPGLFVNPRVVAVGPVAVGRGSVGEFGLQRQIEIARDLQRPLLLEFHGDVSLREVRRVLAILREGELPAERALLLGLPRPAVQLAREVGHWVALTFAHRFSLSRGLVETVNRLGSERILLGSGGPDFFAALPKAASLAGRGRCAAPGPARLAALVQCPRVPGDSRARLRNHLSRLGESARPKRSDGVVPGEG